MLDFVEFSGGFCCCLLKGPLLVVKGPQLDFPAVPAEALPGEGTTTDVDMETSWANLDSPSLLGTTVESFDFVGGKDL